AGNDQTARMRVNIQGYQRDHPVDDIQNDSLNHPSATGPPPPLGRDDRLRGRLQRVRKRYDKIQLGSSNIKAKLYNDEHKSTKVIGWPTPQEVSSQAPSSDPTVDPPPCPTRKPAKAAIGKSQNPSQNGVVNPWCPFQSRKAHICKDESETVILPHYLYVRICSK
ncbi:hypothetical protein BDK51DRAFT_35381, partial [Blyttiomyces helicus]